VVRIAGREIGEHKIYGGQSRRNFAHGRDAQQAKAWVGSKCGKNVHIMQRRLGIILVRNSKCHGLQQKGESICFVN
jgi:predicted hydrocarbon binding protein